MPPPCHKISCDPLASLTGDLGDQLLHVRVAVDGPEDDPVHPPVAVEVRGRNEIAHVILPRIRRN